MNEATKQIKSWDNVDLGKLGLWLFIVTEIMLFGAFFSAYIASRWGNQACNLGVVAWPKAGYSQSLTLAFLNTLILITSSFTMVASYAAAQKKEAAAFKRNLLFTIILGAAFLVIKSMEYYLKAHHGYYMGSAFLKQNPGLSIFISYYYLMTGFHALHILVGLIWNSFLLRSYGQMGMSDVLVRKTEYAGLYWHFVDVIWVFMFPLFYLI